jgi:hypothetical protein
MNMKNILLTTGISLITAGIGFIIGSKWTEKEIKQRTEDFYQKEYDLLKKRFEEDKEQEIRDDQKRKDAEMVEECHKMQEGIRKHVHESDNVMDDIPDQDELEDEEELEEFGGKTEENDIWEESEVDRPRNLCQTQEELDDYDRILYEDRMRREQGSDVYLISYDDYWESRDREEVDLMYDPNTEHLWNEEDPEEELDVDNLVSYEALEILREGYSDIVYVRNDRLDTDFVIQRLDPRD